MKPVQPASSKIWMNKKGSKTSGKNSVNRSGGSATPSIDTIAKTATLRANPSEIAIGSASSPRPWRTTGRKIIYVTA